jgi:hypothetical protein
MGLAFEDRRLRLCDRNQSSISRLVQSFIFCWVFTLDLLDAYACQSFTSVAMVLDEMSF